MASSSSLPKSKPSPHADSVIPPPEIYHHHPSKKRNHGGEGLSSTAYTPDESAKHPNDMSPEELRVQVWDAYRLARILVGTPILEWDDATLFHAMHQAAHLKALEEEHQREHSHSRNTSGDQASKQPQGTTHKHNINRSPALAADVIEKIQTKLQRAQTILVGSDSNGDTIEAAQQLIDEVLGTVAESQDIYAPELTPPSSSTSRTSLNLEASALSASKNKPVVTIDEVRQILLRAKALDRSNSSNSNSSASAAKRDRAKLATDISRLLKRLPAEEDLLESSHHRVQLQQTELEELALQVEMLEQEIEVASPEELEQGLHQEEVALKQKLLTSLYQERMNLEQAKDMERELQELAFAAIRVEDLHEDIAQHQVLVKPQFMQLQQEHLLRSKHIQDLKLQVQQAISAELKSISATQHFLTHHGVVLDPDPITTKVIENASLSPKSRKHPEWHDQISAMVRAEQLELALRDSQREARSLRSKLATTTLQNEMLESDLQSIQMSGSQESKGASSGQMEDLI